jgi:hypothetical protein
MRITAAARCFLFEMVRSQKSVRALSLASIRGLAKTENSCRVTTDASVLRAYLL